MHHVRRHEREILDENELAGILRNGRFAVLGFARGDEPYVVTMNYGFDANQHCLYFHAATEGDKLAFIASNPTTCATVIEDHGYAAGECSHHYRSVVLRGRMSIVEESHEKTHAMETLIRHQEADPEPVRRRLLAGSEWMSGVVLLRLQIAEMTGKGNRKPHRAGRSAARIRRAVRVGGLLRFPSTKGLTTVSLYYTLRP